MSTQPTPEWHNPDGLTNEQVGVKDGWRLYVKLELKGKGDEWWSTRDGWRPVHTKHLGHLASDITTYRTRRPLPESSTEPKKGGEICLPQPAHAVPLIGEVAQSTEPGISNAAAGTSNPDQQAATCGRCGAPAYNKLNAWGSLLCYDCYVAVDASAKVALAWIKQQRDRETLAAETDQAPPQEPAGDGVKWPYNDPRFVGYFSGVPVNGRGHRIHPPNAPAGAEQELKPCPFCGTEPISRWVGVSVPGMEDCGYHAVECPKCVGSGGVPFCGVHADLREDAEKQWNRRPAAPVAVGEKVLKTGKSYASVDELVRDTSSPAFQALWDARKELEQVTAERDAARRERDEAMKAAEDWAKLHLGDYREIISALGMRQELLPVVKAGDFVNKIKVLTAERDRLREENKTLKETRQRTVEELVKTRPYLTLMSECNNLKSALATAQADIVKLCIVIAAAFAETTKPLNASVEYDATPTAAERLKKVQEILSSALDAASATEGGQP